MSDLEGEIKRMLRSDHFANAPNVLLSVLEQLEWAKKWHETCETMMTMAGLSSGGGPEEMLADFQQWLSTRSPEAAQSRVWVAFIKACEEIEDEAWPRSAQDFYRGRGSAAKAIRKAVDHPKYQP